ncbi:MAG: aminoglycoside phosphotransferase family protein [Chloroflexota bacterium]|nr:aminoglycoside phosphotransferase family protein [Chloroflexota bacterium]
MLEKPDISDALIISHLQDEYDLRVAELSFLPLGADLGTAVYSVITDDGKTYFLKLRKGFEEILVTVPLFLKSQGIQEIISPIETQSKQGWADFGEYKMILYPFIEGNDGFERELTDTHRRTLGAALRDIHSAQVPPELKKQIPKETFDPRWRQSLKSFQRLIENKAFDDPTAAKLAEFMKSKREAISYLLGRAGELASELKSNAPELVLCHTDIHGGNMLVGDDDKLYIVDWDNPLLAPKERDLMFIGGGIDRIWKSKREEDVFYEGYGETEIDLKALAYYRYERVIEDLSVTAEQLLLSDEGGADRERSVGWFMSNFEPGATIEIARKTDKFLKTSP